MSEPARGAEHKGVVLITAFDASRNVVVETTLNVSEYYEDLHPLIDDSAYRRGYGIRYMNGKVFDYEGALDQEFENEYDADGNYVHGHAVHGDGTITED